MEDLKTTKHVSTTILQQLGAQRFILMTGAFDLGTDGNDLGLKFRGCKSANYLNIKLNDDDTYTLLLGKIGRNYKIVFTEKGLYNNDLQRVFEDKTGLKITL